MKAQGLLSREISQTYVRLDKRELLATPYFSAARPEIELASFLAGISECRTVSEMLF